MTELHPSNSTQPCPQRGADFSGKLEQTLSETVTWARNTAEGSPRWVRRVLEIARIDFDPGAIHLPVARLAIAVVVALVASLCADAILVYIGTTVFPSTIGYVHFVFSDYAKLTVIGVLGACAAWPLATWITSAPRRFFLQAAVAITLILLLPDAYIWVLGSPGEAVAVLVVMHLAIAVVVYNALVRIVPAPVDRAAVNGHDFAHSYRYAGERSSR